MEEQKKVSKHINLKAISLLIFLEITIKIMNHPSHYKRFFLGQKYLTWAYTDEKPKEDEDIKTHIRRENLELANALAVLGKVIIYKSRCAPFL